ncbi:MAG: dTDP-4-dehydrorhamnose 3,5-epimerase [Bdellovibrionia bacterium]
MKIDKTNLEGVLSIELDLWKDHRGFFIERFNNEKFLEANLPTQFVQDNHSRSNPGVLRGLHFQTQPAQGKLVGAIRGRIWDVAVDIRPYSETFGQYFGIELSSEKGNLLWIPPGFAHGFCVLGEEPADVLYKVDAIYNPKTEGGILWNDSKLQIPWPISDPIISERDLKLPTLEALQISGGLSFSQR